MPSHPDADLHAEATGLAKRTFDAHKATNELKLYAAWFCPFVQRVLLTLEEKSIPYQYIEVNPYNKPDSLMKLNPRGLVPTLEYEGKPLYESNVICELLEEAYPGHSPALYPKELYKKARVRIWCDWMTSRFIPAFQRFLQYQPRSGEDREKGLRQVREEFLEKLKEFTREMDPQGPYFYGAEPTAVDIALAPWVTRLWVFDHFKGGLGLPDKDGERHGDEVWERWEKWFNAIQTRESVQNTTSERQHYLSIYQKYADDKAQSEMAKSIRSGRGVP